MAFDDLIQDLRYTVRTLRRDAGFTTFAVLIAGLGIGASATVFSVVHTLLLRPLPFAEPRQLVWIANRDTSGLSGQTTQVGHMLDLRERTQSLSAVAGYFAFYGVGDNLLSGSGEPERLSGVPVSDNFFDVLGVKPQIGRVFNAEECKWKGPKAVMLGHGLWQRRFNADPAIVGTALILNDEPHTVVGVLPASFDFASVFAPGSHFDLYFPVPPQPGNESLGQHDGDDRPAQARGHGRAGAGGNQDHRRPDRGGASGTQRFPGQRQAARRTGQRPRPARGLGARGRGRDGDADRLRQPLQPAPGADRDTAEGSGDSHRPRRRAPPPAGATADRGHRAVVQRRAPGAAVGRCRDPCAGAAGRGQHSAAARRADRPDRVGLHPGDRDCDRDRVRARARAPAPGHGADQRAQRRGAWLHRRAAARVDPQCARRGGGRLRLRPRRRRGPARSQPDPGARRGDGIPAVPGDDHPRRPRQPLLDA